MKKIISKYKERFACILLTNAMLIAAMLSLQSLYSQTIKIEGPRTCGGYTIDAAALKVARDFESANANRLLSASFSVRVYFHICRNDDGTNDGATVAQIKSEFNQLVTDYSADNICFINMGFDYINNSLVNIALNPDIPADVSWLTPYLVPGCINIFYHAHLLNYGGNAYKIPNTFCSIDKGNIDAGQTISHEVGHCFGLLHTFDSANGYEDINGSNASTAGDQMPDTPADPYAYVKSSCFSKSSCCYTGYCTDPNGQSNFNPPYHNMMAYWWTSGYTNLTITPYQFARVNSSLSMNSDLQKCESVSSLTIGPVTYTSDYHMLSAINTLTTSGTVNLSGTTVTTLGASLVLLEPLFVANSSNGALILIRPSTCIAGAGRDALQITSETIPAITTITTTNSTDMTCYPNPFSQKFTIEFNLIKNDEASINLYDLSGKQLKAISKSFYTKGIHQVMVDGTNLPAGIYLIVLQTTTFRKEQKIIKNN